MNRRRMLLMGKKSDIVTIPNAAFSFLPFNIHKVGTTITVDPTWDLQAYAGITVLKTVWVKPALEGGNDASSGVDEAHALASIHAGLNVANVDRVMVKAGKYGITSYPSAHHWNNATPNRNVEVIGYGGKVYSESAIEFESQSWSSVDNHWELSSTYALGVWDRSNLDANGDYTRLTPKASIAEVDAEVNTQWYDSVADILYVRTFDDREPDTNMMITLGGQNGGMNDAVTYYIEGITFQGAYTFSPTPKDGSKLLMKNCEFKYTIGDCFTSAGSVNSLIILEDCLAGPCFADCIHFATTTVGTNLILINTVARNGGDPADTNANGYSRHGPGTTIAINCEMYGNWGPSMRDVFAGTKTWMLGCYNHDPKILTHNFGLGDGNYEVLMWLDSCISSGAAVDLNASYVGNIIYYRDMTPAVPSTSGNGVVVPY